MTILKYILFSIFSILFFFYLLLPGPKFPEPLPDSVQSKEGADTETPVRRGYFTDFIREEVVSHYKKQFNNISFGIYIPSVRLNYPPEEAQVLIRDQTRSTFLEELVHPFRESIYVNGFEIKDDQDRLTYKGIDYRQKVIIRYVASRFYIRLILGFFSLLSIYILFREYSRLLLDIKYRKN